MMKFYSEVYTNTPHAQKAPVAPVTPPAAPPVIPVQRPKPVDIPGVINQTNQLYRPYTAKE
jgi:hypothetical protein